MARFILIIQPSHQKYFFSFCICFIFILASCTGKPHLINPKKIIATKLKFTIQPSNTGNTDTVLAVQPTVQMQDAGGNTAKTATHAVTLTAYSDANCNTVVVGGLTVTTNPVTATGGVATFAGLKILKTNVIRIGASAPDLNSACSDPMVISPGAATKLAFTTQPSATSDTATAFAQQPVVAIQDANGNNVGAGANAITLTPHSDAGCTAALASAITATTNPLNATAGFATFANVTVTNPSAIRLAATAAGLTSVCSSAIAISAVAFSSSWPFTTGTDASYTLSSATLMSLTANACQLTAYDQTDDDNDATYGFAAGTAVGTAYGTLADGTSTGIKLANAGSCNATTTNCSELDSTWTPQWASLVSYWKMDNNWNDAKGSNNGTAVGNPVFNTTAKIGSHSGHFYATSTYDYISVNDHASLKPTTAISVGIWFKGGTQGNFKYLMAKSCNGSGCSYGLYSGNAGGLKFYIADGAGPTVKLSPDAGTGVWDSNWHYAVGTYDKVKVRLYVDGIEIGTGTAETDDIYYVNTNNFYFNTFEPAFSTTLYFKGLMDDAALWNTALTAAEVKTIYDRQVASYSGTFTSRIVDIGANSTWTSLSWIPTLPFFKALPDYSGSVQNETSANYSSLQGDTPAANDNNLMTGIVGLWHLDEASWNGTASEVIDKSGQNNHGTATNGAAITTHGRFHNGGSFDGTDDYISIPDANSLDLTSAATFSVWFRKLRNGSYERLLSKSNTSGQHQLWSMQVIDTGALMFTVGAAGSNTYYFMVAPTLITDSKWHHYALTYNGTNSTAIIYLDGTLDLSATPGTTGTNSGTLWSGNIETSGGVLAMGRLRYLNASYYGKFNLDEVAIWNKILNATEVQQLYQRGAARLKFQARSCNDNVCSGESWQGPDGTAATYFSEVHNTSTQAATPSGTVNIALPSMTLQNYTSPVATNRYFQYRAILESDSATTSLMPEVKNISVGPTHYPQSNPTIYNNTGANFYTLTAFTETIVCPGGVGYNLSLDKILWYWWDAAANMGAGGWALADGTVTKSNARAVIHANVATFNSQVGIGNIYFKAFLQSDGTQACSLDNIQVDGTR